MHAPLKLKNAHIIKIEDQFWAVTKGYDILINVIKDYSSSGEHLSIATNYEVSSM